MAVEVPISNTVVRLDGNEATGREIKQKAGIDPNRMLTVWRPDGVKLVGDHERVEVLPDDYFEDVPNWRYGG